ncbi:TetR/AcrR family transcriptional regulator [Oricola thermophila]|uniref:TetR/AcrR family transcriptional regulator n=2 Tax=Oricola thermophila TaxID=2742145 RepID=A0A6N1VJA3_9HYPH|nr:TetR/AcrR family transcriptional regulator [Oricola thermophila]
MPAEHGEEPYSPRQAAVLEAALALLVEGGDKGFTTARLAKAANCSKESLYKWFGDRNGLLAAMITFQASKVRVEGPLAEPPGAPVFRKQLQGFAADLLTVLAGPTSLALNRLAIGEAGREDAQLGRLLIERGRRAIEQRAMRMIEAGRRAGLIDYDNRDEAFNALYGLIVGDMHVRMLLGDSVPLIDGESAIARHAARAIDQFLRLYGTADASTATTN